MNWAIVDRDGIVDYYPTESEAQEVLASYPPNCVVEFSPDHPTS